MSEPADEPVDPEACTALLVSVPQPIAERIESFLTSNGIACRIRLNTEIDVAGSEIPPVWDVLVRPDDRPTGEEEAGPGPARLNDPVPGPVEPNLTVDGGREPPGAEAEPGGPVVLCELPWSQAWALTERLIAAGIPAAVMAPEESDRDRPMSTRIVPVGVRPEDLDRARSFAG